MAGLEEVWERLWAALPLLIVGSGAILAIVASVVWLVRRLSGQTEQRALETLNRIMAETALRRDRGETFERVMRLAREGLGATSGGMLGMTAEGGLELQEAVGVQRLDWLAHIPATDPVWRKVQLSVTGAWVGQIKQHSPWMALASAGAALGLARIQGPRGEARCLALTWPARAAAEAHRPTLQQIGHYLGQTWAAFDRVEQYARDVETLNAALQRQEVLIRTAAHDMQNMLTATTGLLGLLAIEEATGEYAELVNNAQYNANLLRQMLEDFTDPARAIEPENVPAEEIVSVVAAFMRRRAGDAGAECSVTAPTDLPAVWGERLSILRVLDNLVGNAFKYNRDQDGLRVWLRVSRAPEAGWVLFEVGDNGQGITADALPSLFTFGFRADAAGRVRGHGLGLWSCRRLVEAHGGRLWVASPPGGGAQFFFTLPTAAAAAAAAAPPAAPARGQPADLDAEYVVDI